MDEKYRQVEQWYSDLLRIISHITFTTAAIDKTARVLYCGDDENIKMNEAFINSLKDGLIHDKLQADILRDRILDRIRELATTDPHNYQKRIFFYSPENIQRLKDYIF